jgi:hypothetical protein
MSSNRRFEAGSSEGREDGGAHYPLDREEEQERTGRGTQSGAARGTRAADRGKRVSRKAAIDLIARELFSLGRGHVERRSDRLPVRRRHR